MLKDLPPKLPVLLQVNREVTVKNTVKDCIQGDLDASFHIADVDLSELFSLGRGWHTAVFLIADNET